MSFWIAIPLTALITLSLVNELRGGKLRESLDIIRTIKLSMVLTNIPVMIVTIAVAHNLSKLPVFDWSWTKLLGASGDNISLIGFQYAWFAPVFAILLFAALPQLAKIEEDLFREETRDWANGVVRSIVFGLLHVIVGIPIGYGLALSIPGLWYTHQYFKGGVKRSTAYHTAWNLTLVGYFIIFLLVGAF